MSETKSSITSTWRALPRAYQWLALALLFIAAFEVWDRTVAPLAASWSSEADAIERFLAEASDDEALESRVREVRSAVVSFGPVDRPGSVNEGRSAMNRAVIDILKKNGVTNDRFDVGAGAKLPREVGARMGVRPDERVTRLAGEIQFEAAPTATASILAALEESPEIEAVSELRLTKADHGKLKVSLKVESWVVERESARGGGGA